MRCTAKMMEEHRQPQEASERAGTMMDELLLTSTVERSAAGPGGGGILGILGREGARRGGVRVTFKGLRRLVAVDVGSRVLFLSLSNSDGGGNDDGSACGGSTSGAVGVISAEELNAEERQPRLPWK